MAKANNGLYRGGLDYILVILKVISMTEFKDIWYVFHKMKAFLHIGVFTKHRLLPTAQKACTFDRNPEVVSFAVVLQLLQFGRKNILPLRGL